MSLRNDFRPGKNFKVIDADAGAKPLSNGSKAADVARTQDLMQQIAGLQNTFYAARERKLLVVLQGMDTSGKDGSVKGVFGAIDPLGIRSVCFKAPTTPEKEHDFLWRVHAQVPARGEIVLFNRSHYEDVLITKVHGWIDEEECHRRYAHIRDFERLLAETGTVILKFFLHISADEQKARFEQRIADASPHKPRVMACVGQHGTNRLGGASSCPFRFDPDRTTHRFTRSASARKIRAVAPQM